MKRIFSYAIPTWALSAILSVVALVGFNIPFFQFALAHAEVEGFRLFWLMTSMVVVLLAGHYLMAYLLIYLQRRAGRVLLAIIHLINAVAVYFVITYHTMLDETMVGNVFNTRYSEASGFFCWQLWLVLVVGGIVPAIYIVCRQVERGTLQRMGKHVGIAFLVMLGVVGTNWNNVLWFGKYDTELGGLVMPWSYLVNSVRLLSHQSQASKEEILLPDAQVMNDQPETVVLVIGESARRANCQLYGYDRETNPLLSQQADLHVLQARSCATYTTAAVRAILEHEHHRDLYEILPNYLFRHEVDVVWRTSNWGEPPLHIEKIETRREMAKRAGIQEPYDELLFEGLRGLIDPCACAKQLIVIHSSTSHGPEYQNQYPREYAVFDETDIVGAYDNTMRYTDACLSMLIDTLRQISCDSPRKTAMIYISDHGESLGENGLFMHGVPMAMAPAEQYEIPCFVWLSPDYRDLRDNLGEVDQHGIFHSVLNLLSITSPIYQPEADWFF